MAAKLNLDIEQTLAAYKEAGSLRGAAEILSRGRDKKIGHMIVKKHLEDAGFAEVLNKPQVNPQSMSPRYKVYIRPEQFEALDRLAARHNQTNNHGKDVNRHTVARQLLDQALADVIVGWVGEQERSLTAV